MGNDNYLIGIIEKKVPAYLIDKVYLTDPPTVYADYKAAVIRFDNLNKR